MYRGKNSEVSGLKPDALNPNTQMDDVPPPLQSSPKAVDLRVRGQQMAVLLSLGCVDILPFSSFTGIFYNVRKPYCQSMRIRRKDQIKRTVPSPLASQEPRACKHPRSRLPLESHHSSKVFACPILSILDTTRGSGFFRFTCLDL
jgi:hypothetical protein